MFIVRLFGMLIRKAIAYARWTPIALLFSLTMRPGKRYWGFRWDVLRSAIKQRDGHCCTECGRKEKWGVVRLQCHHKQRVADGGSYFPTNLTMLCEDCHDTK